MYVDPSGHWFGIDDAVIIATVTVMAKAAAVGAVAGATVAAVNGTNIGQGALMGGISGALVGLGGIAGGALAGVINVSIAGGDLGQGALYGAIGAAAGGLMNLGIGQLGIENAYVQAGVSVVAGGVVAGGLTAIAGGDFGQGFVNGVAGAAAGYFAGAGISALQRSPVSASPEQVAQKAYSGMVVNIADNEGLHTDANARGDCRFDRSEYKFIGGKPIGLRGNGFFCACYYETTGHWYDCYNQSTGFYYRELRFTWSRDTHFTTVWSSNAGCLKDCVDPNGLPNFLRSR